jgi:hypothetical protein
MGGWTVIPISFTSLEVWLIALFKKEALSYQVLKWASRCLKDVVFYRDSVSLVGQGARVL